MLQNIEQGKWILTILGFLGKASLQGHLNKDLNGKGSVTQPGEGAIMKVLQQKQAPCIGMY